MNDIQIKKKLFGSEVEFIIYNTEEDIAKEIIEEAYEEGIRLSGIFNFYDNKSSLSLLNSKRKMKMPEEFIEVLKMALVMCKETNGLYDISLGKQFLERKSGKEISKVDCSYKDIYLNEETRIVELKNKDILIDLGSIAKGYIGDKMAETLIESGVISGLVDNRGDIAIFGEEEKEIAIQHPREKESIIGRINLRNGGIATSGDYNQHYGGFDKSHIINKRDYISVTVIAPTLAEADLYATVLMVIPKNQIEKLLDKNEKICALCIGKDLNMKIYNNFPRILI
jgi:thiamine biosynthesis lipoprotein